MSEPNKDKKLESNTKGKEKEVATDSDFDDTSDSNDSSMIRSAEPKAFDNAMDYFSHKMTQGVAIKEPVAGKRKRAEGGLKRQITLKSEPHVIGMRFDDSDSEPPKVDAVAKDVQVVSSIPIGGFLKDEGMVREDFYPKQNPKHVMISSDDGVSENIELHQIMQIDELREIVKINTGFLTANIGASRDGQNGDLRPDLRGALVQGGAVVNVQEQAAEDANDEEAEDDGERDEAELQFGPRIEVSATATFKVLILGDEGVGKSTFLGRKLNGITHNIPGTDGETMTVMDFPTNLGRYRLGCHKSFGRSMNVESMIGASCAIIFFDVTNVDSLIHCTRWKSMLLRSHVAGIPTVLCGNKIDRVNDRRVSPQRVASMVWYTMQTQYYEISARANYNFEMPFLYLLRRLVNNNDLIFDPEPVLAPAEVNVDLQAQQMNEAEYETALAQI